MTSSPSLSRSTQDKGSDLRKCIDVAGKIGKFHADSEVQKPIFNCEIVYCFLAIKRTSFASARLP